MAEATNVHGFTHRSMKNFNEAQTRLEYAQRIAEYIKFNEVDGGGPANRDAIAGIAGAIETLIDDAQKLLDE